MLRTLRLRSVPEGPLRRTCSSRPWRVARSARFTLLCGAPSVLEAGGPFQNRHQLVVLSEAWPLQCFPISLLSAPLSLPSPSGEAGPSMRRRVSAWRRAGQAEVSPER
jgi:hypothetical protein